jgi:hypothetical protein
VGYSNILDTRFTWSPSDLRDGPATDDLQQVLAADLAVGPSLDDRRATIWSLSAVWEAKNLSRFSRASSVIAFCTRANADGRLSKTWIPARLVSRSWNFIAQLDSKKPFGFDAFAPRCGPGTESPR